jgi:hypothetical protein
MPEGTINWERAIFSGSTKFPERATPRESTIDAERAIKPESTKQCE